MRTALAAHYGLVTVTDELIRASVAGPYRISPTPETLAALLEDSPSSLAF